MSNDFSSITIAELSGHTLVGSSIITDMDKAATDCPELWTQFMARIHEVAGPDFTQDNFVSYGVSEVINMESGEFKYWAAIPLVDGKKIPQGMETLSLKAGLYTKYSDVSLAEITNVFSILYEQWAPAQIAYTLDMGRSCFELYDGRFVTAGTLDLYIPLTAK